MQFNSSTPADSVLVSELPQEIRQVKEDLGIVANKVDVPISATSSGEVGNYAVSSTHVYFYTGDGTEHSWLRAAVASW